MKKTRKWSRNFKPTTIEEFARWRRMKHQKTAAERLGVAKAMITRAARIAKECTQDHHAELVKTKRYCPLCRRAIYGNRNLIPMPIEMRNAIYEKSRKNKDKYK